MQPNNIVTVEVAVKSRLFTHSFAISTNLLGNSHEFLYESHHVKVELPKLSDIQGDDTPYVRVYKGYDAGTVFVKNIDVVLSTNQKVRVPEKSLNMFSERDVYFFEESQRKNLDKLAEKYNNVAFKAYEKWAKVMRWKARATINGPEIRHDIRVKAPSLIDTVTGKQFYFTGMSSWGLSYRVINEDDWNRAQNALKNNEIPPAHIDLMSDAIKHFNARDLQRCVVDLAVACEAFLRAKVADKMPSDTPHSFRVYLDEVNIRRLMDRFINDILDENEKKVFSKVKSNLNQLFDARNKLAHIGTKDDITVEQCLVFLKTVYSLIEGSSLEQTILEDI